MDPRSQNRFLSHLVTLNTQSKRAFARLSALNASSARFSRESKHNKNARDMVPVKRTAVRDQEKLTHPVSLRSKVPH